MTAEVELLSSFRAVTVVVLRPISQLTISQAPGQTARLPYPTTALKSTPWSWDGLALACPVKGRLMACAQTVPETTLWGSEGTKLLPVGEGVARFSVLTALHVGPDLQELPELPHLPDLVCSLEPHWAVLARLQLQRILRPEAAEARHSFGFVIFPKTTQGPAQEF